jgi:hypothetical protein
VAVKTESIGTDMKKSGRNRGDFWFDKLFDFSYKSKKETIVFEPFFRK